MKNFLKALTVAAVILASADVFGQSFEVFRPRRGGGWNRGGGIGGGYTYSVSGSFSGGGVVTCYRGGIAQYCVDIGTGRNHSCYRVSANSCMATEGNGNGGSAGCLAQCSL